MDRVNIVDLQRVINEYENTIISFSEEAFKYAECYIVEPDRMDVYILLWTKEEGRSDLTLSLSCFYENNQRRVEINDCRVM